MKHNYERIYDKNITTAASGVFYLRSPFTGTAIINELLIWLGANVASGSVIFNLRVNGSAKFVGDARPKINTGESSAAKTGLSFPVVKGDIITVDIDQINSVGITAPVSVAVRIDDGSDIQQSVETAHTAADLAAGATENLDAPLGKTFIMSRIATDRPARVRIYSSAAARTADAARAAGVDPVGEHGVILDAVTTADNLILDLAPMIFGSDSKGSRDGLFPAAVQNKDAGAGQVNVSFTVTKLEK